MNRYIFNLKDNIRNGFTVARALLAWIAVTGFCVSSGICQQATPVPRPVPPPGPLLNPAPKFSAWTITYLYPQEQKQRAGQGRPAPIDPTAPRKIVTIKTGDIVHEDTTSVSGAHFDMWQVGRSIYTKPHGQAYWGESGGDKMQDTRGNQGGDLALPPSGFRDLDWVNEGSYAGPVHLTNAVYLLFVAPGAADVDIHNVASLVAQPLLAYVDEETRLPVLLRVNGVIRSFSFSPPPANMQVLPDDLAKEIQDANAKREKLFPAPAREY